MDDSVKYSIGGVIALIIFFGLTPTVIGQMETAQYDITELDSDTVSLDALDTASTDTVTTNQSYDRLVVDTDQVEGDNSTVTLVTDGTEEETVDAGQEIVVEDLDNDTEVSLDIEETEDESAEVEYTTDGEEERDNAPLFALVFLIFTVAFAGAIYKGAM